MCFVRNVPIINEVATPAKIAGEVETGELTRDRSGLTSF